MDLIRKLSEAGRFGSSEQGAAWRIELGPGLSVVRAFRCGSSSRGNEKGCDDPFAGHFPRAAGVAHWEEFYALSEVERHHLELAEGRWVLAVRPHVEGSPLSQMSHRTVDMWRPWALDLATTLRTLHAQRWFHGELTPDVVVVEPTDRLSLVDLPLPAQPDSGGIRAARAPYAAPELWDGEAPGVASDVYGLSVMVCWMVSGGRHPLYAEHPEDWARVHREESPALPEGLEGRVAGAVKRGLAKHPDERPPIQLMVEALSEVCEEEPKTFVPLPPSLYRGLERRVYDEVVGGARTIVLQGDEKTGKTFALERLQGRFQLAGLRAVYCSTEGIVGPEPGRRRAARGTGDPWEPLRRLILTIDDDVPEAELDDVKGDRLCVFETWTTRLEKALTEEITVILWDDLDAAGPDLRAFWAHCISSLSERERSTGRKLRFVAATTSADEWEHSALSIPVVGPGRRVWNGWRGRTLMAHVREIPARKWAQLVESQGSQPVRLFEAINQHLDVDEIPEFAIRSPKTRAMRDVSIIFAGDWRRHLHALMAHGAWTQTVETCRRLYEVLARSGRGEREAILQIWLDALRNTGPDPEESDAYEEVLVAARDGTDLAERAGFLQGVLYAETGRAREAVEIFGLIGEFAGGELVEKLAMWRGRTHLAMEDWKKAGHIAEEGIAKIDKAGGPQTPWGKHLGLIRQASLAARGDEEALALLKEEVSEVGEEFRQLRAVAHRCRGRGLTSCGEFEKATDAYLQGLEEIEAAGLFYSLPAKLLEVADSYAKRHLLGLAIEYYKRGLNMTTVATPRQTEVWLLLGLAKAEVALYCFNRGRPLVERAMELARAEELYDLRAQCGRLAGDLERLDGDGEGALKIYGEALEFEKLSSSARAELLLSRASTHLELGRHADARDDLDRGRRLMDDDGDQRLRWRHGVLRARLQWSDGATQATMAGVERFRIILDRAAEAGEHRFVIEQAPYLWARLQEEGLVDVMSEVARLVAKSRDVIARGLPGELRKEFFSHLPELAVEDGEKQVVAAMDADGAAGLAELSDDLEDARREVERIQSENLRLEETNQELHDRLAEREDRVETLERRVVELEVAVEDLETRLSREQGLRREAEQRAKEAETKRKKKSKRGRKPKAKRKQVEEALERCEYDFDKTAEELGVSKRTLYRYVNRYDLQL